ncbi:hypothetical protein XYCOK13_03300 [Xylanibacillus composti]|uniref:Uncharacterized protein n=1 Tax=Xylanibacillus composti TaxID=1572762 RepID=A0A8J4M1G7_9BACL|nr:hypothetical protein XYCOK13_03300 [Xylanibacillus composti]
MTITQIHAKNPWITAFFSFSFPGFGNFLLHRYAKAFVLTAWEVFVNTHARVNLGIMYSLQGQFEKAKQVLAIEWLLLYVAIYVYGIWDGYRSSVDINKLYLLAEREDAPIKPYTMNAWGYNYLDKREPIMAAVWSFLMPGLGHIYLHKVIAGFFIFAGTIGLVYLSHLPHSLYYTCTGEFAAAKSVLNMQWTLYLPSIYIFIAYDSYVSAVEYNKLHDKEMVQFLRRSYQRPGFEMPV